MDTWKILTILCIATVYADSKRYQLHKRETKSTICDPIQNNTNKVQCFCGKMSLLHVVNADCYQTIKNVSQDDPSWEGFVILQNATKLTLTNTKGVSMNYIPTNALKYTKALLKLDIKYCNIETVEPYAFANLSRVKDITLRDNQVRTLSPNAFAHHMSLKTLSLDQNNIAEINREVFVELPSLEQLFLTGNKITTIHDRAFIHLANLKELEIDKNSIFSLNSETFSGLKNLEKLELSGNSLEVIGDNTFMPLANLRFLNLGENKIQMLDEKAFNGLIHLNILSLANNKITAIENAKVFEPLMELNSLNLKDNDMRVIKPDAISPLLNKFYNTTGQIFLDGNHLSCECSLDVFIPTINKTLSERFKLEVQNLQCYPSDEVKQKWDKYQEIEKTNGQVFEEEVLQDNGAYEYYDDTELNGTLFFMDMRHLLNCSGENILPPEDIVSTTLIDVNHIMQSSGGSTKAPSSHKSSSTTPSSENGRISNRGTLDLSVDEVTPTESSDTKSNNSTRRHGIQQESSVGNDIISNRQSESKEDSSIKKTPVIGHNEISQDKRRREKKDNVYTTSRLATVSANPIDKKGFDDQDMASDEAKPDSINAHRSIQEKVQDTSKYQANLAYRHFTDVPSLVLTILCFKVFL